MESSSGIRTVNLVFDDLTERRCRPVQRYRARRHRLCRRQVPRRTRHRVRCLKTDVPGARTAAQGETTAAERETTAAEREATAAEREATAAEREATATQRETAIDNVSAGSRTSQPQIEIRPVIEPTQDTAGAAIHVEINVLIVLP